MRQPQQPPSSTALIRHLHGALFHPTQAEHIASLSELMTRSSTLLALHQRMLQSNTGRSLLRKQPQISSTSLGFPSGNPHHLLHRYASRTNTLGWAYASFLSLERVSPDTRPPLHYHHLPLSLRLPTRLRQELDYLLIRYRQTHDFLTLKWFEAVHFRLESACLAAIVGPVRLRTGCCLEFGPHHDPRLIGTRARTLDYYHSTTPTPTTTTTPTPTTTTTTTTNHQVGLDKTRDEVWRYGLDWALRSAQQCQFLLAVDYENLLDMDLAQLRRDLNLIAYPDYLARFRFRPDDKTPHE